MMLKFLICILFNRSFDLSFNEVMLRQWGGEKGYRLICYWSTFPVELSSLFKNVND